MTRAKEVATALGNVIREGRGWRCRCPVHDGVSLNVADGRDGKLLVHCWAGCEPIAVLDALRRNGLLDGEAVGERPRPPIRATETDAPELSRVKLAGDLWKRGTEARGSLVETYLASRRLALPLRHHEVIRFHPTCPFKGHRVPAMIALLRDIRTDEPCGIHRTVLLPDGSDRDRVLGRGNLGRAGGAAIKLSPDEDVTQGLGICEGIETGLHVMKRWVPVWAVGSAGNIAKFPVLGGIDHLTIFADHDSHQMGEKSAEECAERWCDAGREVTIRVAGKALT